jgi:hypothetical protein
MKTKRRRKFRKCAPFNPQDGNVDAGLLLLTAIRKPRETFPVRYIAFVCGCNMRNIQEIEIRALRKLRFLLDPTEVV